MNITLLEIGISIVYRKVFYRLIVEGLMLVYLIGENFTEQKLGISCHYMKS